MELRATYRDAGVVTVVDIGGRITLGEGSALLRKTIRELLEEGRTQNRSQPRRRELHRQLWNR